MRPLYLELSEVEFREKVERLYSLSEPCRLCSKVCKFDRSRILGDCRVGSKPWSQHFTSVYNTSGHESIATLKVLEEIVDIYIPDVKYSSSRTASLAEKMC